MERIAKRIGEAALLCLAALVLFTIAVALKVVSIVRSKEEGCND